LIRNIEVDNIDSSNINDLSDFSDCWEKKLEELIPLSLNCAHEQLDSFQIQPIVKGNPIIKSISKILANNKAVTVILEYNYVDRSYLKDFQRYHLSCYQHYKKTCLRRLLYLLGDIHFLLIL
jgi:hypothetical protein